MTTVAATPPSYKIGMEGEIYVYIRDDLEKRAKTLLTSIVFPRSAEE